MRIRIRHPPFVCPSGRPGRWFRQIAFLRPSIPECVFSFIRREVRRQFFLRTVSGWYSVAGRGPEKTNWRQRMDALSNIICIRSQVQTARALRWNRPCREMLAAGQGTADHRPPRHGHTHRQSRYVRFRLAPPQTFFLYRPTLQQTSVRPCPRTRTYYQPTFKHKCLRGAQNISQQRGCVITTCSVAGDQAVESRVYPYSSQ
jgi:hypothetical protein